MTAREHELETALAEAERECDAAKSGCQMLRAVLDQIAKHHDLPEAKSALASFPAGVQL